MNRSRRSLVAFGLASLALAPAAPAQERRSADETFCFIVLRSPMESVEDGELSLLDRQAAVDKIQDEVLSRCGSEGIEIGYRYENFPVLAAWLNEEERGRFLEDAEVLAVGPDERGQGHTDSVSPAIDADRVQTLGVDGKGVTIAVLDTGAETGDVDLMGSLTPGAMHFLNQGGDVGPGSEDGNGHGTHIAGVITSDGILAPLGVAPEAGVLAIQVLDSTSSGWVSDWIAGVDYVTTLTAARDDLAAINFSLGTLASTSACPCDGVASSTMAFEASLSAARDAGLVTLAASGNGGEAVELTSPACLTSAIAVAASYERDLGQQPANASYSAIFGSSYANCIDSTTQADQIACFSNLGACNDLAAPGRSVRSCSLGNTTFNSTGTSPACAVASAAVALLCSGVPTASSEEAVAKLRLTGVTTTGSFDTGVPAPKRLDVLAALEELSSFEQACRARPQNCNLCPCGNDGDERNVGGCSNSAGRSAVLTVNGLPSTSADSLHFEVSRMTAQTSGLLISGGVALPNQPSNPCFGTLSGITNAGDGLRCAGGGTMRHGVRPSDSDGSVGRTTNGWGPPNGPTNGILAQGSFAAGQTRWFQVFYRDNPTMSCGNGINSTQGVGVTILP